MTSQKTYLVTGASSGIGKAVTQKLLQNGHYVVAFGRHLSNAFPDTLNNLDLHQVDFAKNEELLQLLDSLRGKLIPDVILGCAGYGQFGGLEQFSHEQINTIMQTNFLSHAHICRAFLPDMKRKDDSQIIFIGSEAALKGSRQGSMYCASKFALRGFAQALQDECARAGMRVTLINPGMTDSNFYSELDFQPGSETEQHLTVEDIAEAVLHVLHSRAGMYYQEINLCPLNKVIIKKAKNQSD